MEQQAGLFSLKRFVAVSTLILAAWLSAQSFAEVPGSDKGSRQTRQPEHTYYVWKRGLFGSKLSPVMILANEAGLVHIADRKDQNYDMQTVRKVKPQTIQRGELINGYNDLLLTKNLLGKTVFQYIHVLDIVGDYAIIVDDASPFIRMDTVRQVKTSLLADQAKLKEIKCKDSLELKTK